MCVENRDSVDGFIDANSTKVTDLAYNFQIL